MEVLKKSDLMLLERAAISPVSFTHAIDYKGKLHLARSTISPSQQKHLHRLAVEGYLAEAVTGTPIPPETTVTYTLTATGRAKLGIRKQLMPSVYRTEPLTEEQLEAESMVPV